MTILINAISARQGGGQTYLNYLLENIPSDFSRKVYILDNQLLSSPTSGHMIEAIVVPQKIVQNPFYRAFWERFILPRILRKLKVEVYFSPGGLLSIKGNKSLKTVTMCRNMLPFDLPQRRKYGLSYMRFRNWLLSILLKKSFEKADLVIFVSKYALKVLTESYHTTIKRSTLIYHGIDSQFLSSATRHEPYPGLPARSYFLYVSTIDVYKAQIEVVKAFSIYKKSSEHKEKLVFAGASYLPYLKELKQAIAQSGVERDILLLGKVAHSSLPSLYKNAKANIFASECENCPNILLEVLASGRPVLCSNKPPMDEFGEDRVQYFDPTKPEELATLLINFGSLHDNDSVHTALEIANIYSWERTSIKTWGLLGSL